MRSASSLYAMAVHASRCPDLDVQALKANVVSPRQRLTGCLVTAEGVYTHSY